MNNKQQILVDFINNLDPFNMIQYDDLNIYSKEAKLILNLNTLTIKNIEDIFFIGYKQKLDMDSCIQISNFIMFNNLIN